MTKPRNTRLSLVAVLSVTALCLRALIPVGYMPASLDAGGPFVLCPGGNPLIAQFLDGQQDGHEHHHAADADSVTATAWDSCAFAAASLTAIAADVPTVTRLVPPPEPALGPPPAIVPSPPAFRHHARAPPFLVITAV